MRKLYELLTTFEGRINRAKWWLGTVILIVAGVAGGALLNPEFFTADEPPPPNWPDTLWQVSLLIPTAAISVKRFHDLAWPTWTGVLAALIMLPYGLAPHFGMPIAPDAPSPGAAIFWVVAFAQLFVFIVSGCFAGVDGPNRYGPDPLARGQQPT